MLHNQKQKHSLFNLDRELLKTRQDNNYFFLIFMSSVFLQSFSATRGGGDCYILLFGVLKIILFTYIVVISTILNYQIIWQLSEEK
jgi:hypothetical protein